MTDPDNRIAALYRATRQETSPAHLDRAILSAARSAARRRRLRWIVPASSAALVLLGLSISYRFLEDLAELEAPEALAPSLLQEGPASEPSDRRDPKPLPEPGARPAPNPETSEPLRRPIETPAPRATPGQSSETKSRRAAPATPEPQLRARVPEPAMPRAMEAEEESPARPPDQWLEQIRAHKAAGDLDAARDLLSEFLRQFPDAETPQDLRDLIATP